MRDVFERAIRANPDDAAGYAAYADWLQEQGDPRGEFIQVQLGLEDETLPAARRKELAAREEALLAGTGPRGSATGPTTRTSAGGPTSGRRDPDWLPYRFTRGLLTAVEVGNLTVDLAREVVRAPQLRFVRELSVRGIAYQEPGEYEDGPDTQGVREEPAQHVLVRWPQLRHLRVFRFGGCEPFDYDADWNPYRSHTPGDLAAAFARQMPDVEEMHLMAHVRHEADEVAALPMPNLRVLLLYHGWNYPLARLADNPSLTNLRELYCHPHAVEPGDEPYIRLPDLRALCRSRHLTGLTHLQLRLADFGDEGIDEIVASGLLKRLKVLDLRHGLVTDAGARRWPRRPNSSIWTTST